MKRWTLAGLIVCFALAAEAQTMKIGTITPTAVFGPLVIEVLAEAGYEAEIVTFNGQPQLIQALAKNEIDAAFFLAQPLIARIPGAVMVSARISQTDFYAVSLDPAIKVNTPGELRAYSVGIVKDNAAHIAITRGLTTVQTLNDRAEFQGLGDGDYEVLIAVDKLIPVMSRLTGIGPCYTGDRPLLRTPTFLALSSSNAGKKNQIESVFREWLRGGKWGAGMAKLAN